MQCTPLITKIVRTHWSQFDSPVLKNSGYSAVCCYMLVGNYRPISTLNVLIFVYYVCSYVHFSILSCDPPKSRIVPYSFRIWWPNEAKIMLICGLLKAYMNISFPPPPTHTHHQFTFFLVLMLFLPFHHHHLVPNIRTSSICSLNLG